MQLIINNVISSEYRVLFDFNFVNNMTKRAMAKMINFLLLIIKNYITIKDSRVQNFEGRTPTDYYNNY